MSQPYPQPPRRPKKRPPVTIVPSTADMQKILAGGR